MAKLFKVSQGHFPNPCARERNKLLSNSEPKRVSVSPSRMDPEEGDFVELEEGDNEAPMDSDGDDFEETEEERQMQFEELDENGNF